MVLQSWAEKIKYYMKKIDFCSTYFVSMVQQPNTCLARLIVEVSRSHTFSMNSSERVIGPSQRQLTTKHSTNTRNQVVLFLLGNSPASEFYMPTFRNTVPSS